MAPALSDALTHYERLVAISEQLDEEEHTFTRFFFDAVDLMAIINSDGRFIKVNRTWEKMLGWKNLVGTPWLHLINIEDEPIIRDVVGHLVTHDIDRFYCRIRRQDKKFITIEFSASKWVDGKSSLIGRVVPDLCSNCPEKSPRLQRRPHADNIDNKRAER